jgi:hypothetical protein
MLGALFFASSNKCLTRALPTPTYISTKSDPLTYIKGTFNKFYNLLEMFNFTLASPAQALASMVFPVPGGPVSRAPVGIRAPILLYFSGFFRKSTSSEISSLASS